MRGFSRTTSSRASGCAGVRTAVAVTLAGALSMLALVVGSVPAEAGPQIPSLPVTNPADDTPRVVDGGTVTDAGVYELRQVGTTMYAGGAFQRVARADGTGVQVRNNIFAFDSASGAILDRPALTANGTVWAIEPSADGRYLYVGGRFSTFGGRAESRVAKLDLSSGAVVTSFNSPITTGEVTDLQLVSGRLFISGTFAGGIRSADPVTGAATPYLDGVQAAGSQSDSQTSWSTRIYRFAVDPTQTRMVVIGSFTSIGGRPRQQAAMVDLGASAATVSPWYSSTGSVNSWNRDCITGMQWYTRDVDWAPDGSYFVIGTTGGGVTNTFCDTATRWEGVGAPNQQPTWIQYTGGDTIHSVTVTDVAVFLSGHFRWLDNPEGRNSMGPGAARVQGLGAVNTSSGRAIRTWNPTKGLEGGRGGYDIYFTGRGLWLGHFEQTLGHETHPGLGLLPFPG